MGKRLRTAAAVLTAPPIGVAVGYVLVVLLLDLSEDLGPRGLARFFANFMMVGSAVAYAVEAVVCIPAGVLLRRRDRLTFSSTLAVATLGGVIAILPVLRVMTGSASAFAGTMFLGGASGAAAGAWFWVVALRQRKAAPHDEAPQAEVQKEPSPP